MGTAGRRTLRETHELLLRLGFIHGTSDRFQRAYRYRTGEIIIALPNRTDSSSLEPMDEVSLRRHLVDREVVTAESFEAFLRTGTLPDSPHSRRE